MTHRENGIVAERYDSPADCIDAITRALAAAEAMGRESEREACAKVAETFNPPAPPPRPTIAELEAILNAPPDDNAVRIEPDGSVVVGLTTAQKIATAIRSRKDQQT